jgi:hypothetical protein
MPRSAPKWRLPDNAMALAVQAVSIPWAVLVDTWAVLVDTWAVLVDTWAVLVDTWAVLVDTWAVLDVLVAMAVPRVCRRRTITIR